MAFAGITWSELDTAWTQKFNTHWVGSNLRSQDILVDGNEVEFYVEAPDTTIVAGRVFPSIAIEYKGSRIAKDRMESYVGNRYANDDGTTRDVLPDPEPYDVNYHIRVYSRTPQHDRQLRQQIFDKIKINDTLFYSGYYWDMQRNNELTMNTQYDDQRIFCFILPVVVYSVYLPVVADRTGVPIVTENNMQFFDDDDEFLNRVVFNGTTTTIEDTEL